MRYALPTNASREEALAKLRSGSADEIREGLVAIALGDDDWEWAQAQCMPFLKHAQWSIRAVAATCMGHIARVHGRLDVERARAELNALREDPLTADYATDAIDDIVRYLGMRWET